ncbi:hypothetical protein PV10_00448 [Exophiala mesophila]|uniref:Btz domain-containing protein n=1 Tax=Exophiala mesophila TaxID=212818 RepID=A0A0D1Y7D0_EXOME|nr:uncharacterized protein PV10_00448 [Exophiala mesophila]KIV96606.1 hypothetical protein PV10_00448 [Exophiala mesophila]
MPAPRRKNLIASRRRRQDDGEDEGSFTGDLDDGSLSEGSAATNGEGDEAADSESSEDERELPSPIKTTASVPIRQRQKTRDGVSSPEPQIEQTDPLKADPDAQATLEDPDTNDSSQNSGKIQVNGLAKSTEEPAVPDEAPVSMPPRHETFAQRSRREHQEYIQQRNANPAFVPTRGGFFLHDDRSGASNGHARGAARGRGRAYGPAVTVAGRGAGVLEPADKPWAHDLHERHELAPKQDFNNPKNQADAPTASDEKPPGTNPGPNRSFSFSTVLGNVKVQIYLPGMSEKKQGPNVVIKHHTLLPQHRPPLRRDKPVRISIPNEPPRYIFPSIERSFIFIPRAMRPNQQYARGRGRGSFHGSRRPSVYGSVYTPSVAMSRKSSMGASTMRDGMRSPAESIMSRMGSMGLPVIDSNRPIVRMPSAGPHPSLSHLGAPPVVNGNFVAPPFNYVYPPPDYANQPVALPMHQPRPQKAVSVAAIDSPSSLLVKGPAQQQEQPFHQQVPLHMAATGTPDGVMQQTTSGASASTPLSQIPEGAVFAPGFQPYPMMGGHRYYGAPYQNPAMFYPYMGQPFGNAVGGPALAPNFVPGSQAHHVGYLPGMGSIEGGNHLAHESDGMVYYYNPQPMYASELGGGFAVAANGTSGMPNAYNGQQPPFYYSPMPAGNFYPGQSG